MVTEENSLAVSYELQVGQTNSFFPNKVELASRAFEDTVPNCSRGMTLNLGVPEGTTLTIVVAMLSAGAGIVATEFLKHLGEELWHAVRQLILSNAERKEESKDKFVLEFRIGEEYVRASLSDLGNHSEIDLQNFIKQTLPQLFLECAEKVNTEKPNSASAHADPKRRPSLFSRIFRSGDE
jgi:hypothetical protein